MDEMKFKQSHKDVLDRLLLQDPRVRPGVMFGYPAYYVGRKLAMCLYEGGIGLKVPEAVVTQLLDGDPNAIPFQPFGKRRMREWVQINLENSDEYGRYVRVFEQSIEYVDGLQGG